MDGESSHPKPYLVTSPLQIPNQTRVSLNASYAMLGNINFVLNNDDRGDAGMHPQAQRGTPTPFTNYSITAYPGHTSYQGRPNPSAPITVTTSTSYAVPTPGPNLSGPSMTQQEALSMNVRPENFAGNSYLGASSSLYPTGPSMPQNVYVNQTIDQAIYPSPPSYMNQYQVDPMAMRPPIRRAVVNEQVEPEESPLLSELLRTPSSFKSLHSTHQRRRPYQSPGNSVPLPSNRCNDPRANRYCSIPGCRAELRGHSQPIRPPSRPVHWDEKSAAVYPAFGSSGQQILSTGHGGSMPLESPIPLCCLNEQSANTGSLVGQRSYHNESNTSLLAGSSAYPSYFNERSVNAVSLGQESYHNQLSTSVLAGNSVCPRETYSAGSLWQGSHFVPSTMPVTNSLPSGPHLASSSMTGPQNLPDTRARSVIQINPFVSPSIQSYQIQPDMQAKSQTSTHYAGLSGQRLQSQGTEAKSSVERTNPHFAGPSMQGYQIPPNTRPRNSIQTSPHLANALQSDMRAKSTVQTRSPFASSSIQGYQISSNAEQVKSSVQPNRCPPFTSTPVHELYSQPGLQTGSLVPTSCHLASPSVQGLQSQPITQARSLVQTSPYLASSSMQGDQTDRRAKRSAETSQNFKPKKLRLPHENIIAHQSSQNDTTPKVDQGLDLYQKQLEKIFRSSYYPDVVNFLKVSVAQLLPGGMQFPMDRNPRTTSREHLDNESNITTESTIPPTSVIKSEEGQHQSNPLAKDTVLSSHKNQNLHAQSRGHQNQSIIAAGNTIHTNVSSASLIKPEGHLQSHSNILSGNIVPSSHANENLYSQTKQNQNQLNVAAEKTTQSDVCVAGTSKKPEEHPQSDLNNPSKNAIPSDADKDASLCAEPQERRSQSDKLVDKSPILHDRLRSQSLSKSIRDSQSVDDEADLHREAKEFLRELEVISAENSIEYDADQVGMFTDLQEFLEAQNTIKLASDNKDDEIECTDLEELSNHSNEPSEEDLALSISSLDKYVNGMSPSSDAFFIDLDDQQKENWSLSDALPSLDDYSFDTSPSSDPFQIDFSGLQKETSSLSTSRNSFRSVNIPTWSASYSMLFSADMTSNSSRNSLASLYGSATSTSAQKSFPIDPEINATTNLATSTINQDRKKDNIEQTSTSLPSLKRRNSVRLISPKPLISKTPRKPRKLIADIEKDDISIKGDSAVDFCPEASDPSCSGLTSRPSHYKENKTPDNSLSPTDSDFDLSEFLILNSSKRNC